MQSITQSDSSFQIENKVRKSDFIQSEGLFFISQAVSFETRYKQKEIFKDYAALTFQDIEKFEKKVYEKLQT